MPWISGASLSRIRELEDALKDSVPRAIHDVALARIDELNRRVDWQCDMLLRSSQSLPLPPKAEPRKVEVQPRISENDKAKARVVIEQGKLMNLPEQEIVEAVQSVVSGWTEADIAAAINAPNNGHG